MSSSPLSAPSSPLSTLSSPPLSPTPSTGNQEVTKSQHFSYDSPTPRMIGGAAASSSRAPMNVYSAARQTNTNNSVSAKKSSNGVNVQDVELTTPSWDVDNNNDNFFRVANNVVRPQPLGQDHDDDTDDGAPIIGRSRSFWDRLVRGVGASSTDAASRSNKHHRTTRKGHNNGNGSFDTQSQENSSSQDEESLLEAGENDLFAQEVGLMFSTDDGDTIRDENLFAQSLSMSMSRGMSVSFSRSFALDNVSHNRTPSDRFHNNRGGLLGSSKGLLQRQPMGIDENSVDNSYIPNSKYALSSFRNNNNNNNEDNMSIHTSGQSTTLSNKIPTNAKMILGYKNARKHRLQGEKTANNTTTTINDQQAFPQQQFITGDNPISVEEMEKRLREIAGQLNSDWKGPSFLPPALARRLRDFQFARSKRTKRYGASRPWGILGLYDHLSGVKVDVQWAEDAAFRRQNDQPYLTWGDFEKAKNKGLNSPFFTHFTVSVCTAMMIASLQVNGWRFEPIAVNPMIGPSAETLLRLGAKDSYLIVDELEVWRVASPMVLHAGLIHFFLNMFALWFVGRAIEQIHGFFAAVVLFVVPAIGGTILSAIFLPEYITVGASGGIFGLIGACISDIFMNWNLLFNQFVNEKGTRLSHARVLMVLFLDIVVNCLIGLTPFVDNFTHLGGMVYGFLCGLGTIQLVAPKFFQKEEDMVSPSCCSRSKRFFLRFFGVLISFAGIVVSTIVLLSGDGETNPCTSCTYMSCIAFPPWNSPNNKWWYCDDCARATATGTMEDGVFSSLNITCPNGMHELLQVEDSWPQDEIGLEGLLPMLCREHCLW